MSILTMSLIKRLPWLMLLQAIFVLTMAAQTPKSPAKPDEAPTSTVRGRVVYDDTNNPVRRSPISLVSLPERPGQFSSATNRDGTFEITGVSAGIYFIIVDSPGIITPYAFMKLSQGGPPDFFDVKETKEYCTQVLVDGTNNIDITVRARRGGAISGKITYSDGSAAVNAAVGVLLRKGNQTDRILTGLNAGALLSLRTDDRGRYRISALPPGEYLVTASETNTAPGQGNSHGGGPFGDLFKNDALTVSYYGNVSRLADAVGVKVDLGSELNNIDIALSDTTPHAISGSVIGRSEGRALPGATLSIRNKEQGNSILRGEQKTATDSEGQWVLSDVPDGTYLISVEPPYGDPTEELTEDSDDEPKKKPARPKRRLLPKEIEVTVAGSDVAGVAIELIEGGSVSGTIEFPSGANTELTYVSISYAYEGKVTRSYSPYDGVMAENGTFVIAPVSTGKLYLRAEAASRNEPGARFYVKSITHNGVDLRQKPLAVEAGQNVTNVRIVLSSEEANAKVQLVTAEGKPLPGKPVMIVSVNPAALAFANEQNSDVTDANGQVTFVGAPGEYLVIVGGPDESWPPLPDSVRSRRETATRVTLQSGDNKIVTVTVVR